MSFTEGTVAGPFDEQFVPVRPVSALEKASLIDAIDRQVRLGLDDDVSVLETHARSELGEPYRLSMLVNLGLHHYRLGHFSRALAVWKEAWSLRNQAVQGQAKAMADRAVGELIRMHARLGHDADVAALLEQIKDRPLSGPATEAVAGAREGLWAMRNNPGVAYLCGPMAARNVLELLKPEDTKGRELLQSYRSGPNGVSLAQLSQLIKQAKLGWVPAVRPAGADIPVPSVAHWKLNHYAAIVGFDGKRYHVKDPTFGTDLWMTREAVESESSGYFVLPQARLPEGWRVASAGEQANVYGRGLTQQGSSKATSSDDVKAKPTECTNGCPKYNVHSMLVSLNIEDTPVFYKPAYGPSVSFTVTYNQREDLRPVAPNYGHLGPKWTHNWLSYVEDNPTNLTAAVLRFLPGGGSRDETGYNSTTRLFSASKTDRSVLKRVSDSPVRYELNRKDGSKWVYGHSDGRTASPRRVFLTAVVDPHGNAVNLTYDNQNRLKTIVDAAGGVTEVFYEAPQSPLLISRVTNPAGQSAVFAFNPDGRLNSITDSGGLMSAFEYGSASSADFVNLMNTPYGPTTFLHGESGSGNDVRRWLSVEDPMGLNERFEFDHMASGVAAKDLVAPAGFRNDWLQYRNAFYWDKHAHGIAYPPGAILPDYNKALVSHFLHGTDGKTSQVLESSVANPDRRTWFKYAGQSDSTSEGSSALPIEIIRMLPDGSAQTEKRAYNTQGNPISIIDPVGRELKFGYATNGIDVLTINRKTTASAYTQVASFTYNTKHQPLTYTDAAGRTTTYTYNDKGQVTSITNALNQVSTFHYGANGRLASIDNAFERTSAAFDFDDAGNLVAQADSEGRAVFHAYDGLNRRIRTEYPDGTTEEWGYDKLDLASYTNRAGVTTTYTYNANRELTLVEQPVSAGVTRKYSYTYFPNGKLKTFTDPNNNVTTWERDLRGRVKKKIYADQKGYSQTYDVMGRLSTRTDALNQTVTWGYTKDDKVASIKVTGATQSTPDTTFTWDSYYPRVRQMVDAIGTTTYDYVPPGTNGALQLKCDSGAWANNAICHTYDELGRLSSRSVQSADGTDTSTWAYDALGRVLQQSLAKLGVFSYEYLGDTAQVTRRTAPGGIVSTFDYGDNEADRRLSKITHPVPTGLTSPIIGGSPRHVFSYESNPLGQVTRLLSTSSGSPQNSRDQVFGYDLADRLISKAESSSDPSTPGVSMTQYQRDAADNIVKIPAASTPGSFFEPSATFQVNQLNQATSQDGGSRTHDLNGNVLMDQASTYTWDGLDRLVRRAARTSPSVSTWRYDGWNRRAELTENGVTRRYRWCGDEICAVMDTTNKVRVLQHGDRGEVNAGRALVYGEDHLGNVRHVYSGTTGKWLAGIDYDSHGRAKDIKCVLVADCQLPTNGGLSKGYAGLYWHGLSGLYLATYRAYDPRAIRWLSRDPIEEAGGDNLYAYVGGNPISESDPQGLAAIALPAIPLLPALCWADPVCQKKMREIAESAYNSCKSAADRMFSEEVDGAGASSSSGDKNPSTPTGQRGSPIEVKPGTNEPTNIGGRDYSGHALDRMQGRGVPPSAVENAIQNGTKSPGNTPGTTVHTGSNGVTVVTGNGGRVVTVISR